MARARIRIIQAANIMKLGAAYLCSLALRRPVMWGLPAAASIEPANYCNLACPHCPTGSGMLKKDRRLLSLDDFRHIVDDLSPALCYLNLYFQGEPLLNGRIAEMAGYAEQRGIRCCISTNAQLLDENLARSLKEAQLSRLIASIDGPDEESYRQYRRGGSFAKAVAGLRAAADAGLNVTLQCLLLSSTEGRQDEVRRLAESCGVKKVEFKTAQLYSPLLMPRDETLSRYRRTPDGGIELKKKLRRRCLRLWQGAVIAADGSVLPCCYDKAAEHPFGNILEQSIRQIWHSEQAHSFRLRILKERETVGICRNCNE